MKCEECGASVKDENLRAHYRKAHPKLQPPKTAKLQRREATHLTQKGKTVAVTVAIAVAVLIVVAAFMPKTSPVVIGGNAPNFTLTSTTGQTISLSQYATQTVLLEFMDVDCPYCQQEAPILATLYQNYNQKVVFLSIDMNFDGAADTPQRIAEYQTQYNNPWQFMLDPNGASGVSAKYSVSGTPTIFIIRNGTITWHETGVSQYATLAAQL